MDLSERAKEIIDAPTYAHIATLLPSGAPLVSPIWVMREGNLVLMGTGEGTQKAKNTVRDPRVALSLISYENPYVQLQMRGEIIERRPDDDFVVMDEIAKKYTSAPFPWRHLTQRVVLVFEPATERLEEIPFSHAPGSS